MSDPQDRMFVKSFFASVPVWMTRPYGKAFLTAFMLFLDLCMVVLEESFYARLPGLGTPTALPLLGHDRGMIQGMSDTDASFAAKLITWLDRWRIAGSQLAIARAVQDYVGGNPMVRVINRAGTMTTLAAGDGAVTVTKNVAWDWDSKSNPDRADFWSELWVVVYVPPWAIAASTWPTWYWGSHELGLGLQIPRVDVDALRSLTTIWKSAHSFIRCVIFTYDATLFNPADLPSLPDGTWGQWSYFNPHTQHQTRSGRPRTCRFFQPELPPQLVNGY